MKIFAVILFILLLAGCGPAGYRVEEGVARDTIFSVERSFNGAHTIFLTHDDSVAYCALNEETGREALSYLQEHDGEVVLRFSFIEAEDKETSFFTVKCETYGLLMVKLESISKVPGR